MEKCDLCGKEFDEGSLPSITHAGLCALCGVIQDSPNPATEQGEEGHLGDAQVKSDFISKCYQCGQESHGYILCNLCSGDWESYGLDGPYEKYH